MSVTLSREIVSSNEACLSWVIDGLSANQCKATLFLSDLNQPDDINQSPPNNIHSISKYQIRSNEFLTGTHSFTNLPANVYLAKIVVVNIFSGVMVESSEFEFSVFSIAAPEFAPTAYIPESRKITVFLKPRNSLPLINPDANEYTTMNGGKVTFILFGQYILGGRTDYSTAGSINLRLDYNPVNNRYVLEDPEMQDDIEYELSCFYINQHSCSSELSVSKIIRPTNFPSRITELSSVYDSVLKTLTINHNMPNNVGTYVALDCRATITYTDDSTTPSSVITNTYISSENSAGLTFTDPEKTVPSPSDPIVFNTTNQLLLLPIDKVFTITLAIRNSFGYGEESEPISCFCPLNFCSVPVSSDNLIVTLRTDNDLELQIPSDTAQRYVQNPNYDVKFESEIFKYLDTTDAITSVRTLTRDVSIYENVTNSMPSGILDLTLATDTLTTNYELGNLYKYVLNVYYEKTFAGATSIPPVTVVPGDPVLPSVTINPEIMDAYSRYFIPHTNPDPVTLSAVPDNESVTVSWTNLTSAQLKGYKLHHYEYCMDDLTSLTDTEVNSLTWLFADITTVGTNVSHIFRDDLTTTAPNDLINGTTYRFNVRAVSFSDNDLYGFTDRLASTPSTIIATPFGTPSVPISAGTLPANLESTVYFTLANVNPYNGGDFDEFQASIDTDATFTRIEPQPLYDSATGKYSKTFNLSNDSLHTIRIRVVTKNKTDDSVKKFSPALTFTTTPYAKPVVPTGFTAVPRTNTVDLSWTPPGVTSILGNPVKYEVSYKLTTDTEYTLFSSNPVSLALCTVTGLTPDLSYNFRIRSQVRNDELSTVDLETIIYSDSYAALISRPFRYTNPPKMELVTGRVGSTIEVKLSPATGNIDPALNNFYNDKFNYHATIYEKTDTLRARPKTSSVLNIENTNVQTLTLNTFNDGATDDPNVDPQLIDFSLYVIVCYYEMFNTEKSIFYSSNEVVGNNTFPLEPDDAPELTIADTVAGVSSVTLSWTIPKLVGLNIVGYEISNTSDSWRPINSVIDTISTTPHTYRTTVTDYSTDGTTTTPIELGTTYQFWIRAKIQVGSGVDALDIFSAKSNMVDARTHNMPGKPISLVATAIGGGRLKVDWEIGTLGFLSLRSYQIKIAPYVVTGDYVPSNEAITIVENCNLSNTNTFTGLTNGTTYTVSIRMVTINEIEGNRLIFGEDETISAIVYDLATAPANFVTYSNIDIPNTVRLSWDPVTGVNLGGLVLDHYEVYYNDFGVGASEPVNVGLDLSYNFIGVTRTSGIDIREEPGVSDGFTTTGTAILYFAYAVTRKPDSSAINGTINTTIKGNSSARNNIAVSKPSKPTNISVVRSYFGNAYYSVNLPATDGIFYMLIGDNSSSNNGLFQSKNYTNAYQVSLDGINWITPNPNIYRPGYSLPININTVPRLTLEEYNPSTTGASTHIKYGLHTFGGIATNATWQLLTQANNRFNFSFDTNMINYTFTSDGSIGLGVPKNFYVRKVTYNLFNSFSDLAGQPAWHVTLNNRVPDLSTAIYSDPSEVIVNTSYHVSPQQNHYDLPSIEYFANPLLGVSSTPSNGKINLTWDAANSSVLGGLTLNHYEVQLNDGAWTNVAATTTNYEFDSLTNGTEYTLSVRTNCRHTEINISGVTTTKDFRGIPVTVYNVPYVMASAPTGLVKSYPDSQQVKIVWDPVTDLGGLLLKRYEVTSDGSTWIPLVDAVTPVATYPKTIVPEYTFTGLVNGNLYDNIKVRAITTYNDLSSSSVVGFDFSNIVGTSSASISAIPRATPVAPTQIDVVKEDSQLSYTWNYNAITPGLISFQEFRGVASTSGTELIESIEAAAIIPTNIVSNSTVGGFNFTFPFTGLTNGIKYNIKIVPVLVITSTSELIQGNPLITTIPYVPYKVASAPTNLRKTPGDREIKIEWDPVTDLGGLTLQKYQVTRDGTTWIDVASNVEEHTFPELANGTSYTMSVRAITEFIDPDRDLDPLTPDLVSFQNIVGTSATISAIPFVAPGVVTDITTSVTNNIFRFSFTAPDRLNNNNAFTQYYEYSINGGTSWVGIDITAFPSVDVTALGEDEFTTLFRVYILNPNNTTIRVEGSSVEITGLRNINITTPENLRATVGNGFVTLNWSGVAGATYRVVRYVSPTSISSNVSSTTSTITGLTNGTEYRFGVAFMISGSPGPFANISATPMSAPIIGTVSLSAASTTGILSINVDYGGSVNGANIILKCNKASIIDIPAEYDGEGNIISDAYRELVKSNELVFNNIITSNTVSFTVNTPAYINSSGKLVRAVLRNYFDILIINSIGNVETTFTTLDLTGVVV
jgi:hypothetical protein